MLTSVLVAALLAFGELRAALIGDGSPYTLVEMASGQKHPKKFPWTTLVKTPRKKCVGIIVRGQDKQNTPLVLTPASCVLTQDKGETQMRVEIPSMIEIIVPGKNFSFIARNVYLQKGEPEANTLALIKMDRQYKGPAVRVDGVVSPGKTKTCRLVWLTSDGAEKQDCVQTDGHNHKCLSKESMCSRSPGNAGEVHDGQALICKEASTKLWTIFGFCGTMVAKSAGSPYVSIRENSGQITSAANLMELYNKDEVFHGQKISYQKDFSGGKEKWVVSGQGGPKLYYREPVL